MSAASLQPRQPPLPGANRHPGRDGTGPPPLRVGSRAVAAVAAGLLAILGGLLALGIVVRSRQSRELATAAAQTAGAPPEVAVVHPAAAPAPAWSVPGTTQAMQDAIIYARVSGYLSKRHVDLGDPVNVGQLLAEIESPELDQQLRQARANLLQARKQLDLQTANLELARVTMERYKGADQEGAVAKLAVDQAVAAYGTAQAAAAGAQATVEANEASVRQFEAMTGFERVVAPFDGIITQRNVDVGALITAGSPTNNTSAAPTSVTGAATGLFEVSQIDTLRVFINVPQVVAGNVKPGLEARVTVRGALGAPVSATVTRTASALDPGTRTLLTEVDIPNASHGILPGQFVQVSLTLAPTGQRWRLPATALIFNAKGTQVLLVEAGGRLRLQPVTVGRDFGDTIDVQAGLSGGETVVKQPDVSLQDGQTVVPIEDPNAPSR